MSVKGRQYTRVDYVRNALDEIIMGLPDPEAQRGAYVHLYGVGQLCAFLAFKRGHDGKYAELCCVAGMLHDISKYEIGLGVPEHAKKGAVRAWKLLALTGAFTEEEMTMICTGIANHSEKLRTDDEFSEIIKDGDAMQHWLRNPMEAYFSKKSRVIALRDELELF